MPGSRSSDSQLIGGIVGGLAVMFLLLLVCTIIIVMLVKKNKHSEYTKKDG